ncbi:MAG: LytTR family transcriptional regulator [Clostridiales bacterium]|nr:LytTR family transcriptional regulator [Clostridiales bacterium]
MVILKSGFEREEICFYEFHTGEDLVNFFHKKDIYCDLVILDMQLSGILYEKLKNSGFEFAHNSYIVNLNYVKQINTNSLVFISWGEEELSLAVSRSKSKEIHRRFASLMAQNYD